MRRKDREVTEEKGLLEILENCKICRLGLSDKGGIYVVPLNFGYEYEGGKLTLYFHSAKEGRKLDAIRDNPSVGFEMDCGHHLVEGSVACAYGYAFQSIIGNGQAEIVEDVEEKKKALSILMRHQTGKEFVFDGKQAGTVAVIKVKVDSFTGKLHP